MREGMGLRFEGLIRAGALSLGILLVLLSISSMSLISNIRRYLEDENGKRLSSLAEVISRELGEKYPDSLVDPYYLYAVKVRESLADAVLLDRDEKVLLDPSNMYQKGSGYVTGVSPVQYDSAWRGAAVISPIYHKSGGTVRSICFPLRDKDGKTAAVAELSLDAGYIEDLTEQGTTQFFLKAMAAVSMLVLMLYLVRITVASQRKFSQVASGMGGEGGGRDSVSFVVDTFQSMVASLKEKEKELKELKDRAEERARSIEDYSENVLRNIQSGVMTFDREGLVITANAASEAILARPAEGLKGAGHEDVFGAGSWVCRLVEHTLAGGGPERRGEGVVRLKDGTAKWIGAGTSPLYDGAGALLGVILVFTDITEVRDLRERMELRERISVMGEMSAGIAHELRNPMGVISGYAEFLAKRLSDPECVEAVDQVRAEIRGMDDIIREFMAFTQPTELNVSDVDINSIMDEAMKALAGAGEGVSRRLSKADGLTLVEGDAVLLRQAFINIIKNSIEAMPEGGTLRAATAVEEPGAARPGGPDLPPGRYVRVDMEDTGGGMDEKDMARIFTPFYTTKAKGTGLGLALVQKILIYHGGRATVRSVKGKGTTFSVYLPAKSDGG